MNRLLVLATLALVSCAEPMPWTVQWTRPGTSAERLGVDLDQCRAEAADLTERERRIDADIGVGRDRTRADNIEPLLGEMRRFDTDRLYHETVDNCMRARGYRPAGAAF